MRQIDDVPAIPLWIAGHAYLTLTPHFFDVRDAYSGKVLRRTPSCGANEARQALTAARQALPAWAEGAASERAGRLAELADALDGYASHFARLIDEETGCASALASAEVRDAVALLRSTPQAGAAGSRVEAEVSGVLAIVGSAQAPLSALLRVAVPLWRAGAVLVVLPAPQVPSAVFALAELSARCAFPAGVFNVLYGDEALIGGMLDSPQQLRHE